jgi:hypothetical protein
VKYRVVLLTSQHWGAPKRSDAATHYRCVWCQEPTSNCKIKAGIHHQRLELYINVNGQNFEHYLQILLFAQNTKLFIQVDISDISLLSRIVKLSHSKLYLTIYI